MSRIVFTGLIAVAWLCMGGTARAKILHSHGDPTALEQYMLELINLARSNPPQEGIRLDELDTSYTRLHKRDKPEFFRNLRGEFASYSVGQPLAFNNKLILAARGHSKDQTLRGYLGHGDLKGRVTAQGYQGSRFGENIGGAGAGSAADVLRGHYGLMIDAYNVFHDTSPLGHRLNVLRVDWNEVGIGVYGGLSNGRITQNFGTGRRAYLLGVAYEDKNGNAFYDPGEGLPGVRVEANEGEYYAVTSTSGGYALPLALAPLTETVNLTVPGSTWTEEHERFEQRYLNELTGRFSGDRLNLTVTASGGGLSRPVVRQVSLPKPRLVTYSFVRREGFSARTWRSSRSPVVIGSNLKVDFLKTNAVTNQNPAEGSSADAPQTSSAPEGEKWTDAAPAAHGWKSFSWFGHFFETASGWLYHADLGWLYRVGESADSLWFWNPRLGWFWTSRATYPFLWSHLEAGWLYFRPGSTVSSPRLYCYAKREWMSEQRLQNLAARAESTVNVVSPTLKPLLAALLPENILDSTGRDVSRDRLAGKIVGLYFGAQWCPSCRTFTPRLVEFRNTYSDDFEFLYVSNDVTTQTQLDYLRDSRMNAYTLPLRSTPALRLAAHFGVRYVPTLVVLSPNGQVIATNATSTLTHYPKQAIQAWKRIP